MNSKVTYRQQFTRCGKERCRKCKEGAGHGPYWYAYWSVNGRTVSKYIGIHLPGNLEIETREALPRQQSPTAAATSSLGTRLANGRTHKETDEKEVLVASNPNTPHAGKALDNQRVLRIYLLGQFRIERRNGDEWQALSSRTWQRRRARALLGCLLSNAGRRLGREQAMEALWPDLDIETAANRLNGAVHEVRQILEPGIARPAASQMLRLERDVLLLADASQIWVDADVFEGLLNKANATSDPAQVEQILEEAARFYGGDYLLEELYSEWAATRRESLRRGWIGLLLNLAEMRASRGALANAIEPLDRLLATDPTHETAVRRLMVLLTQLDRRGEALRVYHRLTATLQRDYESDPLPETSELYEALRQGYMPVPQAVSYSQTVATGLVTASPGEAQDTNPVSPPKPKHDIQALPRPALQLGRHNQSPLVGRDRELSTIRQLMLDIENTMAEKSQNSQTQASGALFPTTSANTQKIHQFVLLLGEAGIGKTRLAEELSQEANSRGWSVAWTHAYEQEGTIPYRPWTEILRILLQDTPLEFLMSSVESQTVVPFAEASNKMHYIPNANSKLARLSALLPELAAYETFTIPQYRATSPLPPEQERLHLWEATSALLSTLSRTTPLLLVLDDLHWADDSSLELLAYLVRHLQDERILLIGTCRDIELVANSSLRTLINDLRREQIILTLPIQPLTQSQIGSLVAHLPRDIVQSIQIHAGGNPFFAEELARVSETSVHSSPVSDVETPLATQFNTPSEEIPGGINHVFTLPETIAAVLERRLSKLSSECQVLLGKVAVLGGSFEFNQLLFMTGDQGSNEDTILDLLEEALRAGLLTEEGTGVRITYHFWHPLIVSHLYERLSAARRAQMHRRAANALLHLHQGYEAEVAGAITYHLSKGGGELRQIAHYAEIAGNRAFSLLAYSEAEQYYRQAIEAITGGKLPTLPATVDDPLHLAYLLEQVAECNMVKGNYEEARHLYEHVLELRNQHQVSTLAHQSEEEVPKWRQQEAQIQGLIWREIGRTWAETGDYALARQCYKYGIQVMHEAGVISGAAWACLHLQQGNIYWKEGNYDDARRYAQEALEMLEQVISDQHARADHSQVGNAGNSQTASGELQTRTALALTGAPLEVGRCHEILGIISATVGQYTEALKHLNTALALFEQDGLLTALTQVYGNLGAVYAMKAESAVARTYFHRALELAERNGDLPDMAFVIGNLADVAARCGDLLEAEEWFKRSIALAERINDREQMCWCNVALATALQDQGNMRAALECIRRSLALARALKSTRWTAFALVALGDWRVVEALTISKVKFMDFREIERQQQPACNRLLLRAKDALERALALEGLDAEVMTEGHLVMASVYFLLGDLDTAQQKALQTLDEARQRELTRVQARLQRLLGRILAAQGRLEQADFYFEQAIEVFRKYEMRLDYARTLHGYGISLLQRNTEGNEMHQQGLSYLHQARDLFRDCKAAIDLEWTEGILANPEPYSAVIH
jgi:DNA-binding SARP family transcriptional activator/Flp pilus assembly protein TadD